MSIEFLRAEVAEAERQVARRRADVARIEEVKAAALSRLLAAAEAVTKIEALLDTGQSFLSAAESAEASARSTLQRLIAEPEETKE